MTRTVSVVLPVRNREGTIESSVRSVMDQTLTDLECIVVDDGSTDESWEIVVRLAQEDARIRPIRLPVSAGANAARNVGVRVASGQLLAFQDSDDIWLPDHLESLLPFVAEEADCIAFSSLERVGVDGQARTVRTPKGFALDFVGTLANANFVSTQCVLGPRRLFLDHPFDEDLARFQDWDMWLGLCSSVRFVHVDKVGVRAYISGDSISKNGALIAPSLDVLLKRHGWAFALSAAARERWTRTLLSAAIRSSQWKLFVKWLPRYLSTWFSILGRNVLNRTRFHFPLVIRDRNVASSWSERSGRGPDRPGFTHRTRTKGPL